MRNSLLRIAFGPLLVSSPPDRQVFRVKTELEALSTSKCQHLTEIYTIAEIVVQILCQLTSVVMTSFSPKFYSIFHNLCIIE